MAARRIPPYLRLLVLGCIWGTSFLFIKVGLEGLPPLGIALGRSASGAATMLAIVAVRRIKLPRDKKTWLHIAFIATAANVLPFALFSWGELHVTSSVAGVYNATTPLATLAVAMLALPQERPTRARVGGIAIGALGVVIVLGPWHSSGENAPLGQLACLVAASSYGVAFNYTRRYVTPLRLDPIALTASQLAVATAMLAVVTPLAGGHVHLAWKVVGSVLALGALGTGIAFVIYHGLIRDIGATSTSLVTFVAPIIAVALGATVLGEAITWNLFAGAVVVFFGAALAEGRLHGLRRRPA